MLRTILLVMFVGLIHAESDIHVWPATLGDAPQRVLEIHAADQITHTIATTFEQAGLTTLDGPGLFARWYYGCESLAGIDLQRPARFFWGSDGVVMGIIPLSDRARFLHDFTALPLTRTDLIRTGERQGTVVYAYNGEDGIYEYRLLVRDGCAYIAATVEGCELLAAAEWPGSQADQAALYYLDREPRPQLRDWGIVPDSWPGQARAASLAVGQTLLDTIAGDSEALEIILRREDGGRTWQIDGRIDWRHGSDVSNWLSLQQNAASRLLPLLPADGGLLAVHAKLVWSGVIERARDRILAALESALEPEYRPAGWREQLGLWLSQIDRMGPVAMQLRPDVDGGLRLLYAMRHENHTALTLAVEGVQRLYQPVLAGRGLLTDGDAGDAKAGDRPLRWSTIQGQESVLLSRVEVVDGITVAGVVAATTHDELVDDCLGVLDQLSEQGAPVGAVALIAVEAQAGRWLSRLADSFGIAHGALPALPMAAQLSADGATSMQFSIALPIEALGLANKAAGLGPAHWKQFLGR